MHDHSAILTASSRVLAVILRCGIYCDNIDLKDYVALFTSYMDALCAPSAQTSTTFVHLRYAEVSHERYRLFLTRGRW